MLIMRVFKVVDEKRENEVREAQSVKDGARSTKECTLTSSENKTTFETNQRLVESGTSAKLVGTSVRLVGDDFCVAARQKQIQTGCELSVWRSS